MESWLWLNLIYLKGVESLLFITFHPEWTVWSIVPMICQSTLLFEPSKVAPNSF